MKHQTPDSMKFRKLARRLGLRQYEAVGVLELLWLVTQKNAPRGDLGRYDNEEIAIALDWAGDPDELVATLVDCGWLDECREHRLVVHDWHEHAPRYVHGIVAKAGGFVSAVSGDSPALQSPTIVPDYSPRLSPTTVAHCTEEQPNLTYTKPNQTRLTTAAQLFPDDAADASSPGPPPPSTGLVFPTRQTPSDKRQSWELPQSLLDRYEELYGDACDVRRELRNALAWVEASSARRKTQSGMQAFLTKWLTRQANGGARAAPAPAANGRRHTEIAPL